ncbi:MAG: helix-turn-helix domain-containing protein [Deltaproteobacteria bacterium]|nr:helix-turn-helix domain-containing protein [Deltaproteobacteria bacterium]
MIETTSFQPDWISAPGETIEDLLDEKGWSKAEFAQRIGFTTKHVNELVKGRASISAATAERLSRVLGSTPDFWLVRDAQYQAALEGRRAIEAAKQDAGWLDELPLRWMRKEGWVETFRNKGAQVLECCRFFGVVGVDAWRAKYEAPLTAFRASEKFEKKIGAVAAWLREGERRATEMRCRPYNAQRFKAALKEFRAMTNETDPDVFVPKLLEDCAACGVAVVFASAPTGCPASGATRWLATDRAMLLLSLHHRSNDHLWFTFFHEAGHLLLHGKRMMFIEGFDGLDGDQEEEANQFARDLLIPPPAAKRLTKLSACRLSKEEVRAFAQEVGVAPGIVVGRLQRDRLLPWSHMNDLKVRYSLS